MDAMWAKMPYRVGNFSCFLSTMEVVSINFTRYQTMLYELSLKINNNYQ